MTSTTTTTTSTTGRAAKTRATKAPAVKAPAVKARAAKPRAARPATAVPVVIPAGERATGFVAVALRFPGDPGAHRVTRLYLRPDGTEGGMPVRFDSTEQSREQSRSEIRSACRPDSHPADRLYELSTPVALARGAVACARPECFGGTA